MTCLAGSPFVGTNSRGILGARAALSPSRDFALLGAAWREIIQALASKASIVSCRERLGKPGRLCGRASINATHCVSSWPLSSPKPHRTCRVPSCNSSLLEACQTGVCLVGASCALGMTRARVDPGWINA